VLGLVGGLFWGFFLGMVGVFMGFCSFLGFIGAWVVVCVFLGFCFGGVVGLSLRVVKPTKRLGFSAGKMIWSLHMQL